MKYTRPEIDFLELELIDVIQTSLDEGNEEEGELDENEFPLG